MAARKKTAFFCVECGGESPVWSGKCAHCGGWNTLAEEPVTKGRDREGSELLRRPDPVSVSSVELSSGIRFTTGLSEFDRVLGGGVFKGSVVLIGGAPGIGKSTLMLQTAMAMADSGLRILYATGEESVQQVAHRASRVGTPSENLVLLPTGDLDAVRDETEKGDYQILIVDSIQTIHSSSLTSSPGSVSQVRQCASELAATAKPSEITVFVIGHVTKEGSLAGPKVLEHLVDAVISFEGDSFHQYRLLRASKNRFGSTNELGVFEMSTTGLAQVTDASAYFLRKDGDPVAGSAVAAVMEGTRPFLVEVQALTSSTSYGFPQRKASGYDSGRLAMLLAVLERRCGIELGNQDVYVNVAGGFTLSDPGADLAVCIAIASSRLERPVRNNVALSGEVGLAGEIRPVSGIDRRIAESEKLGFNRLARPNERNTGTEADSEFKFDTLSAAIAALLTEKGGEWLS